MAKAARWIAVLILSCWLAPAQAALSPPNDGVMLRNSGELYYFIDDNGPSDASGRSTLEQLHSDSIRWQRADAKTKLPRISDASVWFRFQIAAPVSDTQLMLFYPIPKQNELDVYVIRNGEVAARYETGLARPFSSRPLPYTSYLFPISLRAHEPLDIYVRFRGYPERALDFLQLWPQQKLLTVLPTQAAVEWANIGVMSVASLVAIVVWLFVRQRPFGLFALFISMQLYSYLITRGYAFERIWPNSPAFELIADPLIIALALAVNVGFSIAFLNVREQAPRLYRISQIAIFALIVLASLAPLWPGPVETIGIASILVLYPFVLGISYYLFRYGNNRTDAGIFLLCGAVYMIAILATSATSLLGSNLWYSQHFIDIAQQQRILFLAACLGYRFRQIVRSEESARADARAKSEFLARMSHEIRTPMNGILGMSELLRDAGLNSLQRRYNDIVYASATALLGIINDILDFSKIQAGHMTVEKVPFDLHRLVADVLALFRVKADEKSLKLHGDIRPDVPVWVIGDPTRIRQILINLLSNAIKFTETGEIHVRLVKKGDLIRIEVVDTGPGISLEAQSRLFQSFMQADVSIARHYGGTGLGLAITRQLAELMDGKVGVQSELGKGSAFWVELLLPATTQQALATSTAPVALSAPPTPTLTILVVEDNSTNQLVIEAMVERLGHKYLLAADGAEAIDLYKSRHAEIDMVLMDCHMPGIDGYEATRRIRLYEREQHLPHKTIVALTAHTLQEHIHECRAAGMDGHLAKPLVLEQLQELLAEFSDSTVR